MKRIVVIVVFSFLCFFGTTAPCQEAFRLTDSAAFSLGMGSNYFWVWGDMTIPAGGRPGSGSQINIQNDLGIDQSDASSLFLRSTILENHLVDFDFLMFSPTGAKRVPREIRFHNRTYAPGTQLESKLDFNWFRIAYGYKLWDLSPVLIYPLVGVHYVRLGTTINGAAEDGEILSNNRTLDAAFPVLGLQTRFLLLYGFESDFSLEGIYLFGRGALAQMNLGLRRSVHPDITVDLAWSSRLVNTIEDNQELNNEWFYLLSGWTFGVSFGF